MNLTTTRHLGGTATMGSTASGSCYMSHTTRAPHTTCWMELAVFDAFPTAPSLAGTRVQQMKPGLDNLMASTRGAGAPVGSGVVRLAFELFDDESPMACANFRALCAGGGSGGACGAGATTATVHANAPWRARGAQYFYQEVGPSYRGTCMHKIIPGFCVQGGDLTMQLLPSTTGAPSMCSGNHLSGSPARRANFADENKRRRHDAPGLLSMASAGPNTNGSQFFITTSGAHEQALNGRHVCFGRVTEGLADLLREVAPYGDVKGRPSRYVVVVDCGAGPLPSLADSTWLDATGYPRREGREADTPLTDREDTAASTETPPPPSPPPSQQPQRESDNSTDGCPSARAHTSPPPPPPPTAAAPTVDILVLDSPSAEQGPATPPPATSAATAAAAATPAVSAAPRGARDRVADITVADDTMERDGPWMSARGLRSSMKKGPSASVKRVTIQM